MQLNPSELKLTIKLAGNSKTSSSPPSSSNSITQICPQQDSDSETVPNCPNRAREIVYYSAAVVPQFHLPTQFYDARPGPKMNGKNTHCDSYTFWFWAGDFDFRQQNFHIYHYTRRDWSDCCCWQVNTNAWKSKFSPGANRARPAEKPRRRAGRAQISQFTTGGSQVAWHVGGHGQEQWRNWPAAGCLFACWFF